MQYYYCILQESISMATYIKLGFGLGGGRPEFFLGGLPSGIGGLLTITSIEGVLLHTRGVAHIKF